MLASFNLVFNLLNVAFSPDVYDISFLTCRFGKNYGKPTGYSGRRSVWRAKLHWGRLRKCRSLNRCKSHRFRLVGLCQPNCSGIWYDSDDEGQKAEQRAARQLKQAGHAPKKLPRAFGLGIRILTNFGWPKALTSKSTGTLSLNVPSYFELHLSQTHSFSSVTRL